MTSSNRRERELARAKYERQQARRVQRVRKSQLRQRIVAIVVVAALVLAGGGWALFSLGAFDSPQGADVALDSLDDAVLELEDELLDEGPLVDECFDPLPVRADDISFDAAPPVEEAAPGVLTLATNCGDIVIDVLNEDAPATAASIEFLAGNAFYDSTACHRLTTSGIFVLQCGDPAGNGTGGPGYQIPDENLPVEGDRNYPAGTVAMANAGPGTSGSQFFIVYEDTTLPPGYSIWGQVNSGLDIVQAIAAAGVADGSGDGLPAQPVVIESATFTP